MKKPTKKPDAIDALAKRIARKLFTNAGKERADRLVHISVTGVERGGWAEKSMAWFIASELRRSRVSTKRKGKGK